MRTLMIVVGLLAVLGAAGAVHAAHLAGVTVTQLVSDDSDGQRHVALEVTATPSGDPTGGTFTWKFADGSLGRVRDCFDKGIFRNGSGIGVMSGGRPFQWTCSQPGGTGTDHLLTLRLPADALTTTVLTWYTFGPTFSGELTLSLPPSSPQSLTATPQGNGNVVLSWGAPVSAGAGPVDAYHVYRDGVLVATLGSVFSHTDTTAPQCMSSTYQVRAENVAGIGGPSNTATAAPPVGAAVPSAPTLTVIPGAADGEVLAQWTAPSSNCPLGVYELQRKSAGGTFTSIAMPDPADAEHVETGLEPCAAYTYRLRASNTVGQGSWSASKDSVAKGPIGTPTISVDQGASANTLDVSWTAVTPCGISDYVLLRSSAGGAPWTELPQGLALAWTDTSLTTCQTMHYAVYAENPGGSGATSSPVSDTASAAPPAPPGLSASGGPGTATITVSWSPPVSDNCATITEFRIERSPSASGPYTQIGTAPGASWSFEDNPVAPCQAWYYRARAVNARGNSPYSNNDQGEALQSPSEPQSPSAAPGSIDGDIALAWTAPACANPVPSSYEVYRGTAPGGPYPTLVASTASLGHTDIGLAACTVRHYVVRASNVDGQGPPSAEVSSRARGAPYAPVDLGVSVGTAAGTADIAWNDPEPCAVTSYTVQRAASAAGPYATVSTPAVQSTTDAGLTSCTTYYYRVGATNVFGSSPWSVSEAVLAEGAPIVPQTVGAAPGALAGTVEVTWTPPASDGCDPITGYVVSKATSPGGPYTAVPVASDSTSYTDTDLTPCQTYYYRVTAANGYGNGPPSPEVSTLPPAVPTAPLSLDASGGVATGELDLSWSPPACAEPSVDSYTAYRATSPGGPYSSLSVGSGTSFTDTGLERCTTYYYKLAATNSIGEGVPSAEKSSLANGVPDAPVNLELDVGETVGTADMTWVNPRPCEVASFRVERATSGTGPYSTVATTISPSYNDSGLTRCQTYHYRIRSSNGFGTSAPSMLDSIVARGLPDAPGAPTSTPGTAVGAIELAWALPASDGCDPLQLHTVYRGTSPGGPYTLFAADKAATAYQDTGLTPCQQYYYRLSASNNLGEGPKTAEVTAQAKGQPGVPSGLVASTGSDPGEVDLAWTAPSYTGCSPLTGYEVLRSDSSTGPYNFVATTGTGTVYTDSGLVACRTYHYKIRAHNLYGGGPESATDDADVAGLPTAPNAYGVDSVDEWTLTLSWSPPDTPGCPGMTTYQVYGAPSGVPKSLVANLPPSVSSYDATDLPWDGLWCFEVRAVNPTGNGPWTPEACAEPAFGKTWASGGILGDTYIAFGNDPGCALDGPDLGTSQLRTVYVHDLDPASATYGRWMPSHQSEIGAAWAGSASLDSVPAMVMTSGGAIDCDLVPEGQTWWTDPSGEQILGPPLTVPRLAPASTGHAGAAWVLGGDVVGGDPRLPQDGPSGFHRPTSSVEVVDLAFGSTSRPDMPAGVAGAAAASTGDKVVVSGGAGHPQVPSRLVQTYDDIAGRWTGPHMDDPSANHEVVECGGVPYVIGGNRAHVSDSFSSGAWGSTGVQAFEGGTWNSMAGLPSARSHLAGGALDSGAVTGRMILHGGYDAGGNVRQETFEAAPCGPGSVLAGITVTGGGSSVTVPSWSVASAAGPAVAEHATAMVHGGMYVFGGARPAGPSTPPSPCITPGPDAFGYRCSATPYAFVDISATGMPMGLPPTSVSPPVPLGFPFPFYGTMHHDVSVASDGFLTFDPGAMPSCCSGSWLPTATGPNALIAGFWEELDTSSGQVYFETIGSSPNQRFIVQWEQVPHLPTGNDVTFQIVLHEVSGDIEIHFEDAPSDGGMHATGIEDHTGTTGLTYQFGSYSPNKFAVRFGVLPSTSGCDVRGDITLSSSVDVYNPFTDSWTQVANLPVPTAMAEAVALPNGLVAVIGGRVQGVDVNGVASCYIPTDDVHLFNPVTSSWVSPGSSPLGKVGSSMVPALSSAQGPPTLPEGLIAPAAIWHEGHLYVAGGDETGHRAAPSSPTDQLRRRPSTDVYVWDDGAWTWRSVESLPLGVSGAQWARQEDRLLLVGGHQTGHSTVRLVQEYDPVEEKWSGDHLPVPVMHHGMVSCGGMLYVLGGQTEGPLYHMESHGSLTDAVLRMTAAGTWDAVGTLAQPTAGGVVALGPDGIVLATGTAGGTHRSNQVEVVPC